MATTLLILNSLDRLREPETNTGGPQDPGPAGWIAIAVVVALVALVVYGIFNGDV